MEGSSVLILRTGKKGTVVSLKTAFVGGHTPAGEQWTGGQAGSEAVPWPGQQGVTPGNPQPCSPSLHTTRHWMFPTLANTRVPVHMDITVTQHFIICITIAPAFQGDFGSPSFFTRGS